MTRSSLTHFKDSSAPNWPVLYVKRSAWPLTLTCPSPYPSLRRKTHYSSSSSLWTARAAPLRSVNVSLCTVWQFYIILIIVYYYLIIFMFCFLICTDKCESVAWLLHQWDRRGVVCYHWNPSTLSGMSLTIHTLYYITPQGIYTHTTPHMVPWYIHTQSLRYKDDVQLLLICYIFFIILFNI